MMDTILQILSKDAGREAGQAGEGEIARVRFVSLSPPNKRSLWRGAPR
jgi:hypothetical protein